MRIAFVVHKYPPESLGGTEIYTRGLARAAAALGHNVHVFYPYRGVLDEAPCVERDGVHLWRSPVPGRAHDGPAAQYWHTFRSSDVERAFQDFLRAVRPDIVHFQHVQGVSARLIEQARGTPRVVTLHDYWYFCANSQLVRPDATICAGPAGGWNCVDCATARADLRRLRLLWPLVALPFAYRNLYLRRLAAQADLFLTPSEFLRRQYIAQGFPGDRIQTIENGLDLARLTIDSPASSDEPPGRPHFGFVGSLAWQKGVHVLIDAFNRLPEQAALTIYGSGDLFPDYATALRAAIRHPRIRLAGRLDFEQVGTALRRLDCLVVPSLWYENSPLVIQEAYGVRVPVVASRLGALPEKVHEGETGRLFTAGDAADLARVLRDLIEHPAQLDAFKKRIRPAPGMPEHAARLISLYEDLRNKAGLARSAGS